MNSEKQPAGPDSLGYDRKPEGYFSGARRAFVDVLPTNPDASLLEIGCGNGATASYALEQRKCGSAVGVELCEVPAAEARTRLARVIVGDVESISFDFPDASFDVLLMSEVLEHLRNPGELLTRLRPHLKAGAIVIAGSPNVAYRGVVQMLLRGRWDYTRSGVMDATHLRWFTPATYAELFSGCGYRVTHVGPASPLPFKASLFDFLTLRKFTHLFHTQIVLHAVVEA